MNACLARLRDAGILRCNLFVLDGNDDGKRFWSKGGWYDWPEIRLMSKDWEEADVSATCDSVSVSTCWSGIVNLELVGSVGADHPLATETIAETERFSMNASGVIRQSVLTGRSFRLSCVSIFGPAGFAHRATGGTDIPRLSINSTLAEEHLLDCHRASEEAD